MRMSTFGYFSTGRFISLGVVIRKAFQNPSKMIMIIILIEDDVSESCKLMHCYA